MNQAQAQRTVICSRPINRAAVIADQNAMRNQIFTLGCYSKDMSFTLQEVVDAFGFQRDKAWTQIQRLIRLHLVRIDGTRDRQILYRVNTEN